ncbi:MAG: S49 family peptidase, partial [Myxococcales bacterium]|nr:S49 family peptidase [Myxococcales bacterium]
GSRTIRNAIEDIIDESDIKGVVVRIYSPGGSATASEVMWQGLRRLAEVKPVWVSVGGMAASGGYYTAVGGDKMYVNPSSIVGSIGVVGGKLTMDEAYDHLKLRIHTRSRGPKSDMFASDEAWTESELADVRSKMTETYELFTSRVQQGREGIDLSKTAEGRLFTGTQAIALNMADAIGGLDDAVLDLATSMDMSRFEVVHYPAPKGLEEMFSDMFMGLSAPMTSSAMAGPFPMLAAAREIIGPHRWDAVAASLEAAMQLRTSPVQLVMPRVILFR